MGGGYAGNVTGISEGSKAKQSKQASDRSKAGRHLFGDVLHVYLWVPRARPDIPIVLLPPPPKSCPPVPMPPRIDTDGWTAVQLVDGGGSPVSTWAGWQGSREVLFGKQRKRKGGKTRGLLSPQRDLHVASFCRQ